MKKFLLAGALAASVLLTGCAASTATDVYSVSAKIQGSADTLYIAAEKAGEALVTTKIITQAQFSINENKAYVALLVLRAAGDAVRVAASAGSDTTAALAAEANALAAFNAALGDFQKLVGVAPTAATTL